MKRLGSIVLVTSCGLGAFVVTHALRGPTPAPAGAGARSAPAAAAPARLETSPAGTSMGSEPISEAPRLAMPQGQVPPAELGPSDHKVCDFRVDTPPADILAETPLRTRDGLATFLASHAPEFNEVRRAIVPSVFAETARAERCWKEQGGGAKVEVDLSFSLESDATRARADRFKVRASRGADKDVLLARACLETSLLRPGFAVEASAKQSPFARYSGTYPNVHHIVLQ